MKTALLNICIVAVGITLLKMIIPDCKCNKQINFLISCFFIASAIFMFSEQEISFGGMTDISEISYIDFSEEITAERKERIAGEMSARIKSVLETEGIIPKQIYIIVNISSYYSISINEIKLVLSVEDDYQKATDTVKREVGDDIKISIEIE